MARPFRFRLEAVLQTRQRTFEERQRVVAQRLRQIGAEQRTIEELRDEIGTSLEASRGMQLQEQPDIAEVRRHRLYVANQRSRIAECERRIAHHREALEVERAAMIEASVAVKAMEKLKERGLARYIAELKRRDESEQNETALQMHRRAKA